MTTGEEGLHDDAGGMSIPLHEPMVARMLIEGPETPSEYFIRAGSVARVELLQRWGSIFRKGLEYQCDTLVHEALQYMLATMGHAGEARRQAVEAAIGQTRLQYRKKELE